MIIASFSVKSSFAIAPTSAQTRGRALFVIAF